MIIEKRIWHIGTVVMFLLLIVSARLVYWQMLRGEELQPVVLDPLTAAAVISAGSSQDTLEILTSLGNPADLENLPQPVIQRTINLLSTIQRGSILDRNGRVLAEEVTIDNGGVGRFYTEPSLAHVVGQVTGLRTGVSGLELGYNHSLLGLDRSDAWLRQILHQPIEGSDIVLTIDSRVQRAAEESLRGKTGAVVVLDGRSGAILAMASSPRYDPNRVLEEGYVSSLLERCSEMPDCEAPFLNRATQALYPPGSTWKTITLIAALDTGQVAPDAVFDFGKPVEGPDGPYYVYEVDGGIIPDPNHKEDRLSLELSYAKSANVTFARIGDEMPPDVLIQYASRFGFGGAKGEIIPIEIEYNLSQLARQEADLFENNLLRASTAIGQGELLATPLNMGMVVLAVLNDGNLPVPYLVQGIRLPSGRVDEHLENRQNRKGLMKPETARLVRGMMETVVQSGSGGQASVSGLVTGGKTGTAQVGGNQDPHAWFIGFADNGEDSVAIAVVIENGGQGSQVAAPIFAQLAEVALEHSGEVVEEIVPTPVPVQPTPTVPATPPGRPEETTTPEAPPPTQTPQPGGVPAPDIPYQSEKEEMTKEKASCQINVEGLQGTGEFIWPSRYQALSGGDFKEGHPGLDLSAPSGSPVYAADDGLVIFAGWTGYGYGNAILIDHGNGYQTLYGHLSQISTTCAAIVTKGKLIGLSGSTGNSTGPHLHFEVRVPGGYINPLSVLPLP